MTKEDAAAISRGLLHDGINPDRLTPKARAEIRAAIETILRLARENAA